MAGFTAVSCFVNAAYVTGSLRQEAWPIGPWVWKCWQTLLGILGLGVFVQVMWSTFAEPKTLAPGCLVALAGLTVVLLVCTAWTFTLHTPSLVTNTQAI